MADQRAFSVSSRAEIRAGRALTCPVYDIAIRDHWLGEILQPRSNDSGDRICSRVDQLSHSARGTWCQDRAKVWLPHGRQQSSGCHFLHGANPESPGIQNGSSGFESTLKYRSANERAVQTRQRQHRAASFPILWRLALQPPLGKGNDTISWKWAL